MSCANTNNGQAATERAQQRWEAGPTREPPPIRGPEDIKQPSIDCKEPTTLVPTTNLHAAGYVCAYPRSLDVESYNRRLSIDQPRPGRRGPCTSFSRKSRFALFKTFSKTDYSQLGTAWWITLTYHKRCPAGKPQLEADREAWLERIRRRFPIRLSREQRVAGGRRWQTDG